MDTVTLAGQNPPSFKRHDDYNRDIKINITILLAAELVLAALIGIPLALLLILDLKAAYSAQTTAEAQLRLALANEERRARV